MRYVSPMTTTLHAHVSTAATDCDGPMYRDFVVALNQEELTSHAEAEERGYNDFHALDFKKRVLGSHVSFSSEIGVTIQVTRDGFTVEEPTEEGHRSVEVRWCEDVDCDPDAYAQRDVFAERMGY
jgi:hypothetical protein